MSLIGVPSGIIARCSGCINASSFLYTLFGVKLRVACVAVPLRMLSTTSLSPYGPMVFAIDPVTKGEVLEILSM